MALLHNDCKKPFIMYTIIFRALKSESKFKLYILSKQCNSVKSKRYNVITVKQNLGKQTNIETISKYSHSADKDKRKEFVKDTHTAVYETY